MARARYELFLLPAVAIVMLFAAAPAHANDAEVLPAGAFRLSQGVSYDWSTDQFKTVFGSGTYPVTKWYNITVFMSDISPDGAKMMDPLCTGGKCVLGKTHFDLLQTGIKMQTSFMYGITDKLSMGFIIPYAYSMGSWSLEVTDSNMMLNKDAQGNIDPKIPIVPYREGPGKAPIGAADVETILSHPAFGFEYTDPLNLHEGWRMADIILGGRYQFYQNAWMKNAITLFVITPTGQQKNYNYLFDPANGDGQTDVGFWINNDFQAVENKAKTMRLIFNFSVGYTAQFPQEKKFRVGNSSRNAYNSQYDTYNPNDKTENMMPIGSKSGSYLELRRDIGDNFDFYAGFRWDITNYLILSQEFYYYYKWRDEYEVTYQPYNCELTSQYDHDNRGTKYCGEPGADYGKANVDTHSLSMTTDREELVSTSTLTFSTIPFVQSGKFPVPMMFTLGFKRSLAGKNIEQANSAFFNLDIIGHVCIFKGNCDQLDMGSGTGIGAGTDMNYSLTNQAMAR
jgi:hypothetical protein